LTKIIEFTTGNTLIGPGSIPWEIGNAFSAMFKQDRLTFDEAQKGLLIFEGIPFRYVEPDFFNVLKLSKKIKTRDYRHYSRGKRKVKPVSAAIDLSVRQREEKYPKKKDRFLYGF